MDELINQGISRDDIIYINKELHEFDHLRDYRDLLRYERQRSKGQQNTAVFIDEIQGTSQFERALRDLSARGRYDIYCTGSNADLLSGELSTYLSGGNTEIEIYSLNILNFCSFINLTTLRRAF